MAHGLAFSLGVRFPSGVSHGSFADVGKGPEREQRSPNWAGAYAAWAEVGTRRRPPAGQTSEGGVGPKELGGPSPVLEAPPALSARPRRPGFQDLVPSHSVRAAPFGAR